MDTSNPQRVARVVNRRHFEPDRTLAHPSNQHAFVTNADDIRYVDDAGDLEHILTLIDDKGVPLNVNEYVIIEFDNLGNMTIPTNMSNPGYLEGGKTQGGATEYLIDNVPVNSLRNVNIRTVGRIDD